MDINGNTVGRIEVSCGEPERIFSSYLALFSHIEGEFTEVPLALMRELQTRGLVHPCDECDDTDQKHKFHCNRGCPLCETDAIDAVSPIDEAIKKARVLTTA